MKLTENISSEQINRILEKKNCFKFLFWLFESLSFWELATLQYAVFQSLFEKIELAPRLLHKKLFAGRVSFESVFNWLYLLSSLVQDDF